jgi:ABC-type dipeptide/oligopeptide/nickel transport system permease component
VLFLAIPGFWLGALIVLGAPVVGLCAALRGHRPLNNPIKNLQVVLGPAGTGARCPAYIARMTRQPWRSSVRTISDRTRQGVRERAVLKHALRNAALPLSHSLASSGFLLSGTVVVEQAFNVPVWES